MALQRVLPARALGRAIYAATRSRNRMLKDLVIRGFVRFYQVDVTDAAGAVPDDFESFNAFFTRALKAGARPPDPDPAAILSPADGAIQQIGTIRGEQILQVKGMEYSVGDLLGDASQAARYRDGAFATIYLAPFNYHRVHMPVDGRVERMVYVPGELWSVNATTAARVPRLFARNERVVCHCVASWGRFAVVLVGALNVGSVSTAWAGEVLPRRDRRGAHWDYPPGAPGTTLERGALLGQFNMGSTVVVLLPPGVADWQAAPGPGDAVRVGRAIGRLRMALDRP